MLSRECTRLRNDLMYRLHDEEKWGVSKLVGFFCLSQYAVRHVLKSTKRRHQNDKETAATVQATEATLVDHIGLENRVLWRLIGADIETVGDLLRETPRSLGLMKGIGALARKEIEEQLGKHGLRLAEQ